jgi:hypothetical protein
LTRDHAKAWLAQLQSHDLGVLGALDLDRDPADQTFSGEVGASFDDPSNEIAELPDLRKLD